MKKKRETVALNELVLANTMELDALVEVLVRKGIVTREELLNEIRAITRRTRATERAGKA